MFIFFKASGSMQRIDERVVKKIYDLVQEDLVKREIFAGSPPPDSSNRRFFPWRVDIRNHMYRAAIRTRHSKVDQENLQYKIKEWQQENPSDMFFFRPRLQEDNNIPQNTKEPSCNTPPPELEDDEDDIMWGKIFQEDDNTENNLLFVHQTQWQKELLNKYGNEICLLDATYKTSRYALPMPLHMCQNKCRLLCGCFIYH